MLTLDQLRRVFGDDDDAIERYLTVSARLTLARLAPAPTRPRPLDWHATDLRWITEHLDAMIRAGAITREQADRELAAHRRRIAAHLRGTLTPARGRSLRN
jgi:hypothetical protein